MNLEETPSLARLHTYACMPTLACLYKRWICNPHDSREKNRKSSLTGKVACELDGILLILDVLEGREERGGMGIVE